MCPALLEKEFKGNKLISKKKINENIVFKNQFLKNIIEIKKNQIKIKATYAGDYLIYIHIKNENIYITDSLKSLNQKFEIEENCIGTLLEWGIIPFPLTPFKNTYRLSIGQSAQISFIENKILLKIYQNHYFDNKEKHISNNYSQKTFEQLLCDSIFKNIKNTESTVFMTSGGKDSISIAIACAELGYNKCRFVSYNDTSTLDETNVSESILKKLNLKHYKINYDEYKQNGNLNFLNKFFEFAEFPVIDNAVLPYLISINSLHKENKVEQIIDGMGNDIYLGHILNNKAKMKFFLSYLNFTNIFFEKTISRISKLRYFIRPRQMTYLPSNYLLNAEIKKILKINYNKNFIKNKFKILTDKNTGSKYYKALTRGVHYDFGVAMEKARFVSTGINAKSYFPWTDENLARYLFNQKNNILFNNNTNKVFLREYLEFKLNYNQYKIPKVGFGFNSASFILENKKNIIHSILECSYINKLYGETFINDNFNKIKKNSKYATGIIGLYIVSNWLNKSVLL